MFARWRRRPGRGLLERSLFSVMGPPQLGDQRAPMGFVADPAADLCHRCSQPWEQHARVHTGSMTYRPCPPRADGVT